MASVKILHVLTNWNFYSTLQHFRLILQQGFVPPPDEGGGGTRFVSQTEMELL